jgi:hypothetical protein
LRRHGQQVDGGAIDREFDLVLQPPAQRIAPLFGRHLGRLGLQQLVLAALEQHHAGPATTRQGPAGPAQHGTRCASRLAVQPAHDGAFAGFNQRQAQAGRLRYAGNPTGSNRTMTH